MNPRPAYKIYESCEQIISDSSLKEWEKLFLCQLLDMSRFKRKYDEDNYRKFVESVNAPIKDGKNFLFDKIGLLKKPIIKRRSFRWDEIINELNSIERNLENELNDNFEKFPPSLIQFVKKYGIVPIPFQMNAWKSILFSKKKIVIISAPTGFGKTESFLIPIIFKTFRRFVTKNPDNIRNSLFIYPRRILIEDQASRLIKAIRILWDIWEEELKKKGPMLEPVEQPIIIGLQKGEIPRDFKRDELEKRGILVKKEDGYYLSSIKCLHDDGTSHPLKLLNEEFHGMKGVFQCVKCGRRYFISLSRNNHKNVITKLRKPFILLTTFESLERLFLEEEYLEFFRNLNFLVIDEAHQYSSLYGLHISFIIKKLYDILNSKLINNKKLKVILSSATLPRPKDFAYKLFSKTGEVNRDDIESITITERDFIKTGNYKYFILLLTQKYDYPLKASALIETVMYFAHVLNRIYDEGNKVVKTIVFFDTKGSLYRIYKQFQDAERRLELFRYRLRTSHSPELPEQHNWNLLFERVGKIPPDLSFKPFDERNKLISKITSEFKEERKPIMFCTSAMELGIDDKNINTVIQYGAPRSLLSFVQRIGRGNRFDGDRFFVTILEASDPIDAFFFSNNWLLTEDAFEEEGVSIPELNPIVERIHKLTSLVNKHFIKKYEKCKEKKKPTERLLVESFLQIAKDENITYDNEILDIIQRVSNFSSSDEKEELLKRKLNKLRTERLDLEERIRVRRKDEITSKIKKLREVLSEENLSQRPLTKNIAQEIIGSKEYKEILEAINKIEEILDTLTQIDESQLSKILRELERKVWENLERIEENYSEIKIGWITSRISQISGEVIRLMKEIASDIIRWKYFQKNREEFEEYLVELDTLFIKELSIQHLKKAFTYRPETGRHATTWEKIIYLFQACFWWNVAYLVKRRELFEKYNELIEKLPFIPLSYFDESTEFPLVFKLPEGRRRERLGHMVSDLFIKYFPLKIDFERIVYEQRRPRLINTMLNLEFTKIRKDKLIAKIRGGFREYEYIPKRDGGKEYHFPLKVPLKKVGEDRLGYVKMCNNYHFATQYVKEEKTCETCGSELKRVKIFGYPIFEFKIKELGSTSDNDAITLKPIYALVILRGSNNLLIPWKLDLEIEFKYPLIFPLITPALVIKPQINESSITPEEKEKVLHSLAHLFVKIVSFVTGFSEQILFYSYDIDSGKIYIFERYQGGVGCVQEFYKKFKEKREIILNELKRRVECNYCEDGCPFCIWVGWCKDGYRRQHIVVSRKLLKEYLSNGKIKIF